MQADQAMLSELTGCIVQEGLHEIGLLGGSRAGNLVLRCCRWARPARLLPFYIIQCLLMPARKSLLSILSLWMRLQQACCFRLRR